MNGTSPCLEQKKSVTWVRTWAWFRQVLDTWGCDLTNIGFYYKCSTSEKLKWINWKNPSCPYSPIRIVYKYFTILKAEGSFLVSLANHKTYLKTVLYSFSCQYIPASIVLGWLGKNCPVTWHVSSETVLDLPCCEQARKWFRSGLNHGNLQSRIGMNIQCLLKIQNPTVALSLNGENTNPKISSPWRFEKSIWLTCVKTVKAIWRLNSLVWSPAAHTICAQSSRSCFWNNQRKVWSPFVLSVQMLSLQSYTVVCL